MTEADRRAIYAAIAASERRILARIEYESLWQYVIDKLERDGKRITSRDLGSFERHRDTITKRLASYSAHRITTLLRDIQRKVSS